MKPESRSHPPSQISNHCSKTSKEVSTLVSQFDSKKFDTWYREREIKRNIEAGKPYFNGPNRTPEPDRHSPSRLLKCHRKTYYRLHNAPAETPQPKGIFWIGSRFETEIAVPFLQDTTAPGQYVRNSMWIDFAVERETGGLHIRGETDPVIVDEQSSPLLLTEIKTTPSFANLSSPRPQHLAQVHAYLYGLSEMSEREISDALVIYGKRDDLSLRTFHVRFDASFWEDVLEWAEQDTHYRRTQTLPPAQPEFEWECKYCPYRRRCGKTEDPHSDIGPVGLLPLVDEYPKERLEEYLAAYPKARLTPTLAYRYPELAAEHGSYDWRCVACESVYSVASINWDGDTEQPPQCDSCAAKGLFSPLVGPDPENQVVVDGGI